MILARETLRRPVAPSLSLPRSRKSGVPDLRINSEVGDSRLRMGEGTQAIGGARVPCRDPSLTPSPAQRKRVGVGVTLK